MPRPREESSVSAAHGCWGEDVAADEIDIVAWERSTDTMVFVEVKQHATLSPYARRLRSVDRRKRDNLRRACNAWRRANRWRGGYRFDVIEIYGVPEGGRPVIDHIRKVDLFARRGRFVRWE